MDRQPFSCFAAAISVACALAPLSVALAQQQPEPAQKSTAQGSFWSEEERLGLVQKLRAKERRLGALTPAHCDQIEAGILALDTSKAPALKALTDLAAFAAGEKDLSVKAVDQLVREIESAVGSSEGPWDASGKELLARAKAGDPESMLALAVRFRDGHHARQLDRRAREWFQSAADKGSAIASVELGAMELEGRGGLIATAVGPAGVVKGAIRYLQKGVKSSGGRAEYLLGRLLELGRVPDGDDSDAASYYEEAMQQNHGPAMVALGALHAAGRGVKKSPDIAEMLFSRAAKLKDPQTYLALAEAHLTGATGTVDEVRAMTFARMAFDGGCAAAADFIGEMFEKGTLVRADGLEAMRWYERGARAGDTDARVHRARMRLFPSEGVQWDPQYAFIDLLFLAERDGTAAFLLGKASEEGVGQEINLEEAQSTYELAHLLGSLDGSHALARCLRNTGAEEDAKRAAEILGAAAARGHAPSKAALGELYTAGVGVPKDDARALELLRPLAEAGNADAALTLANMYDTGQGVEESNEQARTWWRRAADGGSFEAATVLVFHNVMFNHVDGVARECARLVEVDRGPASAILMTMIFALALDTPQDHDMAEFWAREAIDRHGATGGAYGLVSPADLAVLYADGFEDPKASVKPDLPRARRIAEYAAARGDEKCRELLDKWAQQPSDAGP